jgi:putative two-component system response regulator
MNQTADTPTGSRVFIIDDSTIIQRALALILKPHGHEVRAFCSGREALLAADATPPDLILLDLNMPEMSGFEVCAGLKANPRLAAIPVIFLSGNAETFDKLKAFSLGGVDYITKPFNFEEVEARIEAHLKIRHLQSALDQQNSRLQDLVHAQVKELSDSQIATIVALAKLAEYRDEDTGFHIMRVQRYCRALALRLAEQDSFGKLIDKDFIDNVFHASALHDVGKVAVPDAILLKPGPLTDSEFSVMKRHTVLGAQALAAVLGTYPKNMFIRMGMELARSHHERFAGGGYPDSLVGDAIPLPARILIIADQYDALRTKRPYKPAFDHARTCLIILEGDGRTQPSHFDPRVLAAFRSITDEFAAIFETLCDSSGQSIAESAMGASPPALS